MPRFLYLGNAVATNVAGKTWLPNDAHDVLDDYAEDLRKFPDTWVELTAGNKRRIMVDGDSLIARSQREQTISGATQTGGVATYTTSAPHFLLPGMTADTHLGGSNPTEYSGRGTVMSVPSSTTFSKAVNAAAAATDGAGFFVARQHKTDLGLMWWAEALSGLDFSVVNTVGRGGRSSSHIQTQFPQTVLSQQCEGVLLMPTVNDAHQAVSSTTSLERLEAMIKMVQDANRLPIVLTSSCFSGVTYNTTGNNQRIFEIARGARRLARKYGLPLCDTFEIISDPTSATMVHKSGFADPDGIHLMPAAYRAIALQLHPLLTRLGFGRPIKLCSSLYDVSGSAGSTNLLLNPGLTGTAGPKSGGTPPTGNVADNWRLTNNGMAATPAASKGTLGDLGVSQIVTFNDTVGNWQLDTSASFHASIVAGRVLRSGCAVRFNYTGTIRLAVFLTLTPTGGSVGNIYAWSNLLSTAPMSALANETMYFQTPEFTVPAGATYSDAKFGVQVVCMAGGSNGTAEFYQPYVHQDSD